MHLSKDEGQREPVGLDIIAWLRSENLRGCVVQRGDNVLQIDAKHCFFARRRARKMRAAAKVCHLQNDLVSGQGCQDIHGLQVSVKYPVLVHVLHARSDVAAQTHIDDRVDQELREVREASLQDHGVERVGQQVLSGKPLMSTMCQHHVVACSNANAVGVEHVCCDLLERPVLPRRKRRAAAQHSGAHGASPGHAPAGQSLAARDTTDNGDKSLVFSSSART